MSGFLSVDKIRSVASGLSLFVLCLKSKNGARCVRVLRFCTRWSVLDLKVCKLTDCARLWGEACHFRDFIFNLEAVRRTPSSRSWASFACTGFNVKTSEICFLAEIQAQAEASSPVEIREYETGKTQPRKTSFVVLLRVIKLMYIMPAAWPLAGDFKQSKTKRSQWKKLWLSLYLNRTLKPFQIYTF